MKFSIKGKYVYILVIAVITLLSVVIVPTYAKFVHDYETTEDIVGMNLNFDIKISSIDQYEEITVSSGSSIQFNVEIFNNTEETMYYGIWYKMIVPSEIVNENSIQIGKIETSTVDTSGTIDAKGSVTVGVGVNNYTSNDIKLYIGVNSSNVSTGDIEYLNGKYLITGEIADTNDIFIESITVDGVLSEGLPVSGYYDMTYQCAKGSVLTWDPLQKTLAYAQGSYVKDTCSLVFTSSTDYPLLNEMAVGSYVEYVGNNGCSTCNGNNVNYTSDDDMGYCGAESSEFIANGWRIGYIENNSVYLVSAGATDCICTSSDGTTSNSSCSGSSSASVHNSNLNNIANLYCNVNFAVNGLCDGTTAWAINATDFQKMIESSSTLSSCVQQYGSKICGYGNDLIDNGGNYWFANASNFYGWIGRAVISPADSSTSLSGVRPVLRLDSTVVVTDGKGTYDKPYIIN